MCRAFKSSPHESVGPNLRLDYFISGCVRGLTRRPLGRCRWVRLCCRAILMARIEDVLVAGRAFGSSPSSPSFSDFCWAWFEPSSQMRDAYL